MAIFNSYVSLPEGILITHEAFTRRLVACANVPRQRDEPTAELPAGWPSDPAGYPPVS